MPGYEDAIYSDETIIRSIPEDQARKAGEWLVRNGYKILAGGSFGPVAVGNSQGAGTTVRTAIRELSRTPNLRQEFEASGLLVGPNYQPAHDGVEEFLPRGGVAIWKPISESLVQEEPQATDSI